MTVEIISCSISTKVWDLAMIKLATPGSAVGHITDCSKRPDPAQTVDLLKQIVCLFDLILYVHSTIFQLCGTVLLG